jgi:ribosomal protein L1
LRRSVYTPEEAIEVYLRTVAVPTEDTDEMDFDWPFEVLVDLNLDPQHHRFEEWLELPHGTLGNNKRIVYALCPDGEMSTAALNAGAIEAGEKSIVDKIRNGQISIHRSATLVASRSSWSSHATDHLLQEKLEMGRKVPNLENQTLADDTISALESAVIKHATGRFLKVSMSSSTGIVKSLIGHRDSDPQHIVENLWTILRRLAEQKPAAESGEHPKDGTGVQGWKKKVPEHPHYFLSVHISMAGRGSLKLETHYIRKKIKDMGYAV